MKDGIEIFRDTLKFYISTKEHGFQGQIADAVNIARTAFNDFLAGRRNLSEPKKDMIARYLGFENFIDFVSRYNTDLPVIGDLVVVTSDEDRKTVLENKAADYMGIPLYESGRLAAGVNGAILDPYEQPSSTVVIYRPEIKNRTNHDLRALRVGGDSMSPIIPQGSIVIIDLSDREYVKRKIYCVNKPESGEWVASIKRVQKTFYGFLLMSENQKYDTETTEMEWKDLCVGRVIWMWRNIEDA